MNIKLAAGAQVQPNRYSMVKREGHMLTITVDTRELCIEANFTPRRRLDPDTGAMIDRCQCVVTVDTLPHGTVEVASTE